MNINAQDSTQLIKAVYAAEDLKDIEKLLKKGADPNIPDDQGDTALMGAVINNDVPMAQLLIKYGASVDVKDSIGKYPIGYAMDENYEKMFNLLLKHTKKHETIRWAKRNANKKFLKILNSTKILPPKRKPKLSQSGRFPKRLGLYQLLQQKMIPKSTCVLSDLISDIHVLKKTSVSDSVIVFGKYKLANKYNVKRDVSIKISYALTPQTRDNSLEIEVCIYKKLINGLIDYKVTPNVMAYIDSYKCLANKGSVNNNPEIIKQLKVIHEKAIDPKGRYNLVGNYDFNNLLFLILERGSGYPLDDIAGSLSVDEWKSILFQLFYTLAILAFKGLRHNDIHFGNIFIERNVSEKYINYWIDENTYYQVPTHGNLVKIFDLDFSYYHPCGNNTKITMKNKCKRLGVCNTLHPKFDTFLVLWLINSMFDVPEGIPSPKRRRYEQRRARLDPKVVTFLEKVINQSVSKDLVRKRFPHTARICDLDDKGNCKGEYIPSDVEMKAPNRIIVDTNLFDEYKRQGPYVEGECNFNVLNAVKF